MAAIQRCEQAASHQALNIFELFTVIFSSVVADGVHSQRLRVLPPLSDSQRISHEVWHTDAAAPPWNQVSSFCALTSRDPPEPMGSRLSMLSCFLHIEMWIWGRAQWWKSNKDGLTSVKENRSQLDDDSFCREAYWRHGLSPRPWARTHHAPTLGRGVGHYAAPQPNLHLGNEHLCHFLPSPVFIGNRNHMESPNISNNTCNRILYI